MENAADALKMGAAILVFSIALATVFSIFSQARQVSDAVFLSIDNSEYIEYMEGDRQEGEAEGTSYKRTVGLETIIPVIYNYYDEKYNVEILKKDGSLIKRYEIGSVVITDRKLVRIDIDNFVRDKLLKDYKNAKFEESIVEENYSGRSYTDPETGETIVDTTESAKLLDTIITITYRVI